jgi:hypothetical protein
MNAKRILRFGVFLSAKTISLNSGLGDFFSREKLIRDLVYPSATSFALWGYPALAGHKRSAVWLLHYSSMAGRFVE